MLHQETWLLPKEVILTTARQQRDKEKPTAQERQSWSELRAAALFAYALMKLSQEEYVLKPVPLREHAPDVTMGKLTAVDSVNAIINEQPIEVVSYTEFSKRENLAEFLWRTKLDPHKKWYGFQTLILCYVEACHILNWEKIHTELQLAAVPAYTVAIIHNLNNLGLYEAGIIYPELAWRTTFQFFPDVYRIEQDRKCTATSTMLHSQNAQSHLVALRSHQICTHPPSDVYASIRAPQLA